jgi:hypothetical protein
MTPQERQLVTELFDRLASLENAPRDPEAERLIAEGLQGAPHAPYALVQTVLVQDEALKRANARIQELEGQPSGGAPGGGGFLDTMRTALLGRDERRGSVPSVRPGGLGSSGAWGSGGAGTAGGAGAAGAPSGAGPQSGAGAPPAGAPYGQPGYGQPAYPSSPFGGGGSFLGTAAASAAGVIGGSMLLHGISSMFGHSQGAGGIGTSAFGAGPSTAVGSPWSGSAPNSDLARDAGINDIGSDRSDSHSGDSGATGRAGLVGGDDHDDGNYDTANDTDDDTADDTDDDTDMAGDVDSDDSDLA